jgi:hypothetical protein
MSFVTQGPVPPGSRLFAGRVRELKTIDNWCTNLDCFATVMGARQTGKTSFLSRFKDTCRHRFSFVWVNLQDMVQPESQQVYEYIGDAIAQQLPGAAGNADLPSDSTGFLSFLRHVGKDTKAARVVLILDEFGALPPGIALKLAQTLRPVFNDRHQKEEFQRYFVVLAGATDMLKLTSGDNSPLANVTQSIYIPDLTLAESEQVLQEGWRAPDPHLSLTGHSSWVPCAPPPLLRSTRLRWRKSRKICCKPKIATCPIC